MSMTKIYGIKNCDTMKKAFKWLEENNVTYEFHDYKKQGIDEEVLRAAIHEHGWENAINRRGPSWHKLPDAVKDTMDEETAIAAANENSSIVKRPLLTHNGKTYLGFKDEIYKTVFKK
ncbi:MAG: ArsC family reductase [Alphaproteobacteria bacterium]